MNRPLSGEDPGGAGRKRLGKQAGPGGPKKTAAFVRTNNQNKADRARGQAAGEVFCPQSLVFRAGEDKKR